MKHKRKKTITKVFNIPLFVEVNKVVAFAKTKYILL